SRAVQIFFDLPVLGGPATAVTCLGRRGGAATAGDHPVKEQQQQGAANGKQPAAHSPAANTAASPQGAADQAANLGPGDSQQHGDKDSSRIFSRHDELGDGSGYQTKNGPANN